MFPALQVDSLPAGVGSLSLLQGIFLTQESNRRLLHCRQILYQLSYEGSSFTACFGLQAYFIQFYVTQEIESSVLLYIFVVILPTVNGASFDGPLKF